MKGFPKNLNTKEDYEYVRLNFSKDVYKPVFQDLLDSEYAWFYVRDLKTDEVVTVTDNLKIIDNKSYTTDNNTRALYELKSNPLCKMYSLGYTKDEVLSVINN